MYTLCISIQCKMNRHEPTPPELSPTHWDQLHVTQQWLQLLLLFTCSPSVNFVVDTLAPVISPAVDEHGSNFRIVHCFNLMVHSQQSWAVLWDSMIRPRSEVKLSHFKWWTWWFKQLDTNTIRRTISTHSPVNFLVSDHLYLMCNTIWWEHTDSLLHRS